ncbi:MAG: helix-turn-helix transcriptional regulator [Clostridia bacterium]|nr:helix-turn-helix transcriptional regulator [Clostridia bacterium]
MDIGKQIGNNLKLARKSKGFTQKDVAQMLLMTQQQYSRFENGVFELNYNQILKLCKIYDVTPNDIFDVNEEN